MVRETNGQFKKGVSGNPKGRPKRQREIEYYRLLETAVTKEDWIAICIKAVEQARRGDAVARKWLSDYLIGPPVERKEVTGKDGGIIRVTLTGDIDD